MWIRSQSKGSLIRSDGIGIIHVGNSYTVVSGTLCLGSYKTKEKALSILDEIENRLNDEIEFNLGVYQMPKDSEVE